MAGFEYEGLSLEEAMNQSTPATELAEASDPQSETDTTSFQFEGATIDTARQVDAERGFIDGVPPDQLPPHLKKLFGVGESIITPEAQMAYDEGVVSGEEKKPKESVFGATRKEEVKDLPPEEVPEDIDTSVYTQRAEISPFMKRQTGEAAEGKMEHQVKLFGETIAMSTAQLKDFFSDAPNVFRAILPDDWTNEVSINGQSLSSLVVPPSRSPADRTNADLMKGTLMSIYEKAGMEPSLEEVKDMEDIATFVLAGNVAPTGAISTVRAGVAGVGKYTDDISNFLKGEMSYNIWGTNVGVGAALVTEGSIDEKKATAELWNMLGMGGRAVWEVTPFNVARKGIKTYQQGKEILESENAYGLAEDVVRNHLASMLPAEEVPEIMQRMNLVSRIQAKYPDFNPTVGNVVGTEDFKMAQRITDSKNPEIASARYAKNKQAVRQMVKDLSKETDPSQRSQIAAALKMYAHDTRLHVQKLQEDITSLEQDLRVIPSSRISGAEAGKDIRDQLKVLKKEYRETVSEMYRMVDPENKTKFDARGLLNELKKFTTSNDPSRVVTNEMKGYDLLNRVLPKFISTTAKRGKAESGIIDLSAAPSALREGTTPDTVSYLTFTELRELRTMLQDHAKRISRTDPSSNAPGVMGEMVKHIEDTINTKMLSGPEDIVQRFKEAREFASTEAYPRYRNGDGGTLLKEDPFTGIFKIRDDEIGPTFWKKGAKSSSLEEFNKIFTKEHPALRDAIEDKATRADLAEAASDIAMDSLKSYAMRTLQDSMDKAPNSRPIDVLNRWKVEYRDAIDAFPAVKEEVARLEEQYIEFADQKLKRTAKIEDLNNDIVKKYSGVEASTVVKDLTKNNIPVEEVERRIRDMYRAVLKEDGDTARSQAFDQLYPDTIHIDFSNPKLHAVRKALQESMAAELLRQSFDQTTGFASGDKLRGLLHKNEEKLRLVYGGDAGMQHLYDIRDTLIMMGTENKPLFQKDLNHIRSVMKAFGISPASILSRYYSASLGKVGPVYLVSDALTRLLTGVTDKHFDQAYRKTLYDLDALKNVLDRVGQKESADLVEETRKTLLAKGAQGLVKLGKKGMGKFINDHTLLVYERNYEAPEDDDKIANEESGQLLQEWLEMYDKETGQPTRLAVDLMDTGEDEEDALDLYERELQESDDGRNAYDILDGREPEVEETTTEPEEETEVEGPDYVANVIVDTFSEAGLDPEIGLIFGQLESSMGRFLEADTSSAKGVFQFVDGTWKEQVGKHADKYGFSPEEADVFNVEHNAAMGAEFLKGNAESLKRAGFEASPENLYAAHFLGAGGARTFLRALKKNPKAPASAGASAKQIKANPKIFRDNKGRLRSLDSIYKLFQNKIEEARNDVQAYLDDTASPDRV